MNWLSLGKFGLVLNIILNTYLRYILLFLLLTAVQVSAVEVENLYTGKILVTDKTQQTRIKAHKWAIEQVLTKVTGSRDILKVKRIQQEVRLRTANYIKSYAFMTDELGRTFLVDEFDQVKIDNLLRGVGASIWGKRRPETLIWLALEEGINRFIASPDNFPQYTEMLIQSGDDRGLPIVIPAKQTISDSNLYSSDIWARFDKVVWKETQSLGYDHFVMARMFYDDSQTLGQKWSLDYVLVENGQRILEESLLGQDLELLKQMVNNIGDYFAKQYAIKSEGLGVDDVEITITNLTNVIELQKAEKFLRTLPPVAAAELQLIENNTASFKLVLSGQGLDVIKAMALMPEFEQKIIVDKRDTEEKLSIEQQLELLTKEYLQQVQPNPQEEGEESVAKTIRLTYEWQGK